MKPWLEDLSEEWVIQPTPVVTVSNDEVSAVIQALPPKPRSLLPRMRHSSGSFSEIQVKHVAKDQQPPKCRSALAERTMHHNNIAPTATSDAHDPIDSRCASRSFSAASIGSVIHNSTVAQKPTKGIPRKDKVIQDTPEWRRRLLKGDIGYGDQKDLFSPMGLENIFQKPGSGQPEEQIQRKSKLGLFKSLSVIPSSPPPWPSTEQKDCEENSREGLPVMLEEMSTRTNRESLQDHCSNINSTRSFSSTQLPAKGPKAERTISGQLEFENESFSPVYLSTNLKPGVAPSPIPNFKESDLAHRLRHLGSPPPTDAGQLESEDNSISQSRDDSSFAKLPDVTLPEDLPAGTPDIADVGRFVEMRRGGYSQDGSFRRRALSPSPQRKAATRSILEDSNSLQIESQGPEDSGLRPEAPSPPQSPITPLRQKQEGHLNPERAHASASPLKLFDAHDTFTSNRLQRRLSQLEYRSGKTIRGSNQADCSKVMPTESRLTSVEEASLYKMTQTAVLSSAHREHEIESRRLGTFGHGQLDQYSFPEDFSITSSEVSQNDQSAPDNSPSFDVTPPGSRQPLHFHLDGSPQSLRASKAKRQGLIRVSNPFRTASQGRLHHGSGKAVSKLPLKSEPAHDYAEGKRGPTSPFKNPTPKRRRTLHLADTDDEGVFDETQLQPIGASHVAMQSVVGRKRKDARHEQSTNVADPEVLARRHILRPRNPTPSQRRKDELHAEIIEATMAFLLSSPKLNTIQEQLDSPVGPGAPPEEVRAAAIANEVAAFNMNRIQVMKDESRKRSVTTQDFLDEAVKIMDYIRAKGRPTSGLGSLEESASESLVEVPGNPPPSSPLTFSRPPSREGRMSAWREPNKCSIDPTVMSHLQKYQDKESDDFMGSSVRSLRFARMRKPASPEGNSIVVEQDDIRITDNLDRHNKTPASEESGSNMPSRTEGSHPSTSSSTGQTVSTSISRKSEHVTTLAPGQVAHLIPEQIAGMTFDREKNMWIRQKSPSKEHRPSEDVSLANESEEDPFGNIPDLTVNETAEILINKGSPARPAIPQPSADTFLDETEEIRAKDQIRPATREGRGIPQTDTSSVPSKVSNFAWSFPKTDTRATSWSDQEARNGETQKLRQAPTTNSIPESDEIDVEHEIKYYEGRGTATSATRHAQIRDITFSVAEQDFGVDGEQRPQQGGTSKDTHQEREHDVVRSKADVQKASWCGAKTLPHSRKTIHGRDGELSTLDDLPTKNYRVQLSMSVSAPVLSTQSQEPLLAAPSSPAKGDITFMLSDLPEFTLNQVDEREMHDRVVVMHDGSGYIKALEDRYALGTAELVKALQDVEADEPFWEDLREVDLHDKSLTNLHRLDEFCCRLESLDVSNNNISQVTGIPYTMRRLQVQNNYLTGLTSWTMLVNLQYLDVSGNSIDSLDGLSDLVHLRTLKADDNKIRSLNDIFHLDGLMELSANNNQIESIDFAKSGLKSLSNINVRGNCIVEVRNLHILPQLQRLDLDDNSILEFPTVDSPTGCCNMLRSLRLCNNGLTSLNVEKYCPNLESLHVDGNCLARVIGIENLKHLRTFSVRNQNVPNDSMSKGYVGDLMENPDVRNLYISMNLTRSLGVSQHLLNLQKVELASMGLKELPDDFGQLTPNLRSINLNFNSIKDLRPLLNIKRLTELLVAGNKLARLRTNLAVLGKLTTVSNVDLRDNPLTLRFYSPTSESRVMSLRKKHTHDEDADRSVLPAGDIEMDKRYLERLDFETRLRRRVLEIMLSTSCKSLRQLDGLPFDRARILMKDDVWERLLFLGVIRRTELAEGSIE